MRKKKYYNISENCVLLCIFGDAHYFEVNYIISNRYNDKCGMSYPV